MPEAPAPVWRAGWWSGARACPSPNFGQRPAGVPITLALLHSISLPPGVYGGPHIDRLFTNTLDWDQHPYFQGIRGLEVSSHFVISRLGAVTQYVSCDDRAWHAGRSVWEGRDNCNDWSIGIELEGLEGEVFEPAQYDALIELLGALAVRYPIESVAGHEHVAPGRKLDPGPGFNWNKVGALMNEQGWRWPAGVLDAD